VAGRSWHQPQQGDLSGQQSPNCAQAASHQQPEGDLPSQAFLHEEPPAAPQTVEAQALAKSLQQSPSPRHASSHQQLPDWPPHLPKQEPPVGWQDAEVLPPLTTHCVPEGHVCSSVHNPQFTAPHVADVPEHAPLPLRFCTLAPLHWYSVVVAPQLPPTAAKTPSWASQQAPAAQPHCGL
jgi:hypothetical protein